jgi:hypothetical protein
VQDLSQELRIDNLVTPQDIPVAGTVNTNTGMYRSMSKYRKGLVAILAHLSNTKTCVAQLVCGSDASGTGKENVIGKTVTLTGSVASPEQKGVIEFDVNDLIAVSPTKYYVGVDLTTDQDGDDVAAVLIRGAARYFSGSDLLI